MYTRSHLLTSLVALPLVVIGCGGRDPELSRKNDDALVAIGEGEGEGEGVRQLVPQALFGDLPVENRFLEPLFTLAGSGWFAYTADFSKHAVFYTRAVPTPSKTRALELAGTDRNRSGSLLLGQYKSGRGPQLVSVWVGHDAALTELEAVSISVFGTFVGSGEQSVDLAPDAASAVTIGTTRWVQFSVALDDGPLGWATLMVQSLGASAVLVAGPLAESVDASPAQALVRRAPLRASTATEDVARRVLRDRMLEELRPAARPTLR